MKAEVLMELADKWEREANLPLPDEKARHKTLTGEKYALLRAARDLRKLVDLLG